MKNIFTQHPNSIGESYFQHLKFAFVFGTSMLLGGLACMLHAILPFLFQKTGSNLLLKLCYEFIERMPVAEDRVIILSQAIESKRQTN